MEDPHRFAALLAGFIAYTEPAEVDSSAGASCFAGRGSAARVRSQAGQRARLGPRRPGGPTRPAAAAVRAGHGGRHLGLEHKAAGAGVMRLVLGAAGLAGAARRPASGLSGPRAVHRRRDARGRRLADRGLAAPRAAASRPLARRAPARPPAGAVVRRRRLGLIMRSPLKTRPTPRRFRAWRQ